jgi:glycosyltransferase involved in cell wall biosynthesis
VAGKWRDDAVDELRAAAGATVELTGWVSQERLEDLYREASVYVQASVHEGFGMSVAEAMLAGCIPVTTKAGALPEVVGDTGVAIEGASADDLARAIERALAMGDAERERARRRVLELVPLGARHDGILKVVEEALTDGRKTKF